MNLRIVAKPIADSTLTNEVVGADGVKTWPIVVGSVPDTVVPTTLSEICNQLIRQTGWTTALLHAATQRGTAPSAGQLTAISNYFAAIGANTDTTTVEDAIDAL